MNAWELLKRKHIVKIATDQAEAYHFLKEAGFSSPTVKQIETMVMLKMSGARWTAAGEIPGRIADFLRGGAKAAPSSGKLKGGLVSGVNKPKVAPSTPGTDAAFTNAARKHGDENLLAKEIERANASKKANPKLVNERLPNNKQLKSVGLSPNPKQKKKGISMDTYGKAIGANTPKAKVDPSLGKSTPLQSYHPARKGNVKTPDPKGLTTGQKAMAGGGVAALGGYAAAKSNSEARRYQPRPISMFGGR